MPCRRKERFLDGGVIGWSQVAATFCFAANFASAYIVTGVLFEDLREFYGASATAVAWFGAIYDMLNYMAGPLCGALVKRFNERTVGTLGGVLFSSGVIATAFMPYLPLTYITFGLMGGLGSSFLYSSTLVSVSRHFDQRKSLAFSISHCAIGISYLVSPSILQWCNTLFGFQGAILIMGGIVLHCIASGMLLYPTGGEPKTEVSPKEAFIGCMENPPVSEPLMEKHKDEQYIVPNETQVNPYSESKTINNHNGLHGNALEGHAATSDNLKHEQTSTQKPDVHVSISSIGFYGSANWASSQAGTKQKNGISKRAGFDLDVSLLKKPIYLCLIISQFIVAAGLPSFYYMVPSRMREVGLTETHVSLAIMCMGIGEIAGRLVIGPLMDIPVLQKHNDVCFGASELCMALVNITVMQAKSLWVFCVCSFLMSFVIGFWCTERHVLITKMVPASALPSGIGIAMLFHGLGVCVGSPLSGAIVDLTGTYKYCFLLSCVLFTTASVVFFLAIGTERYRSRKAKKSAPSHM